MRRPKIKNPVDMHVSFEPETADVIKTLAIQMDVPRSAIIRGLAEAGIKSIFHVDTKLKTALAAMNDLKNEAQDARDQALVAQVSAEIAAVNPQRQMTIDEVLNRTKPEEPTNE